MDEKNIAQGVKLPNLPISPTRVTILTKGVSAYILHRPWYYGNVSESSSSGLENRFSKTKICFLSRRFIVILVPVTRGLPFVLKLNI